jgi:hypothetical protein
MKKSYSSPTLVASGDIVTETLNGLSRGLEIHFRRIANVGSVGFYL